MVTQPNLPRPPPPPSGVPLAITRLSTVPGTTRGPPPPPSNFAALRNSQHHQHHSTPQPLGAIRANVAPAIGSVPPPRLGAVHLHLVPPAPPLTIVHPTPLPPSTSVESASVSGIPPPPPPRHFPGANHPSYHQFHGQFPRRQAGIFIGMTTHQQTVVESNPPSAPSCKTNLRAPKVDRAASVHNTPPPPSASPHRVGYGILAANQHLSDSQLPRVRPVTNSPMMSSIPRQRPTGAAEYPGSQAEGANHPARRVAPVRHGGESSQRTVPISRTGNGSNADLEAQPISRTPHPPSAMAPSNEAEPAAEDIAIYQEDEEEEQHYDMTSAGQASHRSSVSGHPHQQDPVGNRIDSGHQADVEDEGSSHGSRRRRNQNPPPLRQRPHSRKASPSDQNDDDEETEVQSRASRSSYSPSSSAGSGGPNQSRQRSRNEEYDNNATTRTQLSRGFVHDSVKRESLDDHDDPARDESRSPVIDNRGDAKDATGNMPENVQGADYDEGQVRDANDLDGNPADDEDGKLVNDTEGNHIEPLPEGDNHGEADDDETSAAANDLRMEDDNRSRGEDDDEPMPNDEADYAHADGASQGEDVDQGVGDAESPVARHTERVTNSPDGARGRALSTGSSEGPNRHRSAPGADSGAETPGGGSAKRSASGGPQIASYVPLQGGPFDTRRVFVGRLLKGITADVLQRHFSTYGKIERILLPEDPSTGRSKGFAFITFVDPNSLKKVLSSPQVIDGVEVDCKPAFPKDSCHGSLEGSGLVPMGTLFKTKKLFIGGLAATVTSSIMRKYFSRYGTIVDCRVILERATKQSRGYGFCEFASESSVDRAMRDYKIHTIAGKWVQIKRAMPQPPNGNSNVVALTHTGQGGGVPVMAGGNTGSMEKGDDGRAIDRRMPPGRHSPSSQIGDADMPGPLSIGSHHNSTINDRNEGMGGNSHRVISDSRQLCNRGSSRQGTPVSQRPPPHHSMHNSSGPMMPPSLPGRGSLLGPAERYYGGVPGPHEAYHHPGGGAFFYVPPHPAMGGYSVPPMMPSSRGRSFSAGRSIPAEYGIIPQSAAAPICYRGESPGRRSRMHYAAAPPPAYYEMMPTRGGGNPGNVARRGGGERSAFMDPGPEGWPPFGGMPPVDRDDMAARFPFFADSPVDYPVASARSGKRKASWSPHPGPERNCGTGGRSSEEDDVSDGQGGLATATEDSHRRTVRHGGTATGGSASTSAPSSGSHSGYHRGRDGGDPDRGGHSPHHSTHYSMAAMASRDDHRMPAHALPGGAHPELMYYRRRRTISPASAPMPAAMDRRMMYALPPEGMPPMYSHAGMLRPDVGIPAHHLRGGPDSESVPMVDSGIMVRGRPTHSGNANPSNPPNRNKRRRGDRLGVAGTPSANVNSASNGAGGSGAMTRT